jgi:hypothetical protein
VDEQSQEEIELQKKQLLLQEEEKTLPPGWRVYLTKTPRHRPFYHNTELNKTQWFSPNAEAMSSELPAGWTMHRTKTPRARVFYHNKAQGVTQWTFPKA